MQSFLFVFVVLSAVCYSVASFKLSSTSSLWRLNGLMMAKIEVAKVSEIALNDRKVVDLNDGSVIIANVDGNFFAVNSKCPHLGNKRDET